MPRPPPVTSTARDAASLTGASRGHLDRRALERARQGAEPPGAETGLGAARR